MFPEIGTSRESNRKSGANLELIGDRVRLLFEWL